MNESSFVASSTFSQLAAHDEIEPYRETREIACTLGAAQKDHLIEFAPEALEQFLGIREGKFTRLQISTQIRKHVLIESARRK